MGGGVKCDVNIIAITIVLKSRTFIVNALDDLENRSELIIEISRLSMCYIFCILEYLKNYRDYVEVNYSQRND